MARCLELAAVLWRIVVSALVPAGILVLNATGVLPIDLQWEWWGLVAFIAFVGLVTWQVYLLSARKPAFTVALDPEDNDVRLRIENHGGPGEFEATAQEVDNEQLVRSPWNMQWRGKSDEHWVKIAGSNGREIVNVASRELDAHRDPTIVFHTAKMVVPSGRSQTDQIYKYYPPSDKTEQEIHIVIRSDPESLSPWRKFEKRYLIRLTLKGIIMECR